MTEKLQEALGDLSSLLKNINNSRSLEYNSDYLKFIAKDGKDNFDQGLIWSSDEGIKHLLLKPGDRLSTTENFDISKNKSFMINGVSVLSDKELGSSVIKSNLRQVGRLRNLEVEGSLTINGYVFYNGNIDRLGLGTDQPNSALSIAEDGIEIIIGTFDNSKGRIGTFAYHDLEFVTDNVPRITLEKNGNITFGNRSFGSVNITAYGKLYLGKKNIDSRVDLHVDGPIKFQEHIHQYSDKIPTVGDYIRGDIIWNSEPDLGKCVGWVCVRSGSPGGWLPFGEIKHQ
jgi:hypothetical protein